MKKIVCILITMLMLLTGSTVGEVSHSTHTENKTPSDYWKEQAYVNLKYMKYKISQITNDTITFKTFNQ